MLPSELVSKLSTLLSDKGEFPTATKVIQELLAARNSTPNDLADQTTLLLSEPSLAVRLIHVVRSGRSSPELKPDSLYQTLTLFGHDRVIKWAKSLVAVDQFSSLGRFGGAYERTCAMAVAISLVIPALATVGPNELHLEPEAATLLGWCASSGIFAAVLTYPHLFESIFVRVNDRNESFEDALLGVTGFSSLSLSVATCGTLDLPHDIPGILKTSASSALTTTPTKDTPNTPHIRLLHSATLLTHAMLLKPRTELGAVVQSVSEDLGIDLLAVREVLAQLPDRFDTRCRTLGIKASLPDHIVAFSKGRGSGTFLTEKISLAELHAVRIDELRESILRSDPISSVILSAMEFLVWDFGFDRCVLMLTDVEREIIAWSSYLGRIQLEPFDIKIDLSDKRADVQSTTTITVIDALKRGAVTFEEQSLLPNGIGAVIVPIGYKGRAVGVLYCDRVTMRSAHTVNEVATLTSVSDVLDECVRLSKGAIE